MKCVGLYKQISQANENMGPLILKTAANIATCIRSRFSDMINEMVRMGSAKLLQ